VKKHRPKRDRHHRICTIRPTNTQQHNRPTTRNIEAFLIPERHHPKRPLQVDQTFSQTATTDEAHRKYPSANTTTTTTMSDQNPFQSSNATAAASNQENQQPQETQQQQEEKKAGGADKNQGDDSLYVSPSDAIMSPASQKLSSFKQRQINKYVHMDGKPQW
jgi:hypothetical protein